MAVGTFFLSYQPSSIHDLATRWLDDQSRFLIELEEKVKKGEVISNNAVFLHRSPISLISHGKLLKDSSLEDLGWKSFEKVKVRDAFSLFLIYILSVAQCLVFILPFLRHKTA